MRIDEIMDKYGLDENECKFVQNMIETNGNKARSYARAMGHEPEKGAVAHVDAVKGGHMMKRSDVAQAYRSALAELYPDRAETFKLTQQRVVEDIEAVKQIGFERLQNPDVQAPGSIMNALVRGCELQGKTLGMMAERHKHEHIHATIPTDELIERLEHANPALAKELGKHLKVSGAD